MNDYDEIMGYVARALTAVLLGILVLLFIELVSGCTRTIYVPQTTIQRDSIYLTKLQRDSIWLHDSITLREKGDTIWLEKWHTKYIERVHTDTAYISRTDTIREPYPIIKPLTQTQSAFILIGKCALVLLVIVFVIFAIFKLK